MIKRVFFFLLVNIAVIATISIITSIFGIGHYVTQQGLDYQSLLIFCALWGMVGSFISLKLSKWMAKRAMGVKIISPSATGQDGELVKLVHRLSMAAGLKTMPEVGYYESPEINAFATGPSKSNSLVAVSSGLLNKMDQDQVEAVLAHEVSHIANGDMVTMALIQGVINAFVMFLARVVAFAMSSSDDDDRPQMSYLLVFVLDILFSILGSIVVNYFSRLREFRADHGAANLSGKEKMISALRALGNTEELIDNKNAAFNNMKISGRKGFSALFSTHPSLEDRIQRLERGA